MNFLRDQNNEPNALVRWFLSFFSPCQYEAWTLIDIFNNTNETFELWRIRGLYRHYVQFFTIQICVINELLNIIYLELWPNYESIGPYCTCRVLSQFKISILGLIGMMRLMTEKTVTIFRVGNQNCADKIMICIRNAMVLRLDSMGFIQ